MLKHDAALGPGFADALAVEHDVAGVGRQQPRHEIDERRLAGSRVADDGHELALLQREVHAAENLGGSPRSHERFPEAVDLEKRHQTVRTRASTKPMTRSRVKPMVPIVMTDNRMCE